MAKSLHVRAPLGARSTPRASSKEIGLCIGCHNERKL